MVFGSVLIGDENCVSYTYVQFRMKDEKKWPEFQLMFFYNWKGLGDGKSENG